MNETTIKYRRGKREEDKTPTPGMCEICHKYRATDIIVTSNNEIKSVCRDCSRNAEAKIGDEK